VLPKGVISLTGPWPGFVPVQGQWAAPESYARVMYFDWEIRFVPHGTNDEGNAEWYDGIATVNGKQTFIKGEKPKKKKRR
jgi:hypothetical protein